MYNSVEIMAPAGSFESLMAAIKAGAGSVYFGVGKLNMRARSASFQLDDLENISNICKENNVASYLTLNTLVYDAETDEIKEICDRAKEAGISAIIAMDISVIQYARSIGLEVHMSTQVNISNYQAVKFYSSYADVIVLAREVKLEQIRYIHDRIVEEDLRGPGGELIRLEVFVHGALCIAISGKCGMSLAQYDKSANRGACYQTCRRAYTLKDKETGEELVIDNQFVMSPSDLCTLGMLDQLIMAGATVLKIEGRGRSPEYVYHVVSAYKKAIGDIEAGVYNSERKQAYLDEVSSVFNRGFWHGGYYLGIPAQEWSSADGSKATTRKVFIGPVTNYFSKIDVVEIHVQTKGFALGDKVLITGPTTGVLEFEAQSIHTDAGEAEGCSAGQIIGLNCPGKVRRNDQVYIVQSIFEKI